MRPYTPLELAGRNIYVREGCYLCHSQMIRPLRDEVERYGHYSLAAESMYDHPFQWGSKRNGPDLARVGGKYSDEWHRAHLPIRARSCRDRSCRPIPCSARPTSTTRISPMIMKTAGACVGVPYTTDMIANAQGRRESAGDATTIPAPTISQALSESAVAAISTAIRAR